MPRSLLVILLVAALSGWIGHLERGPRAGAQSDSWVRTADGWQARRVLQPISTAPTPQIHPALVGAFQLAASMLALGAFPSRAATASAEAGSRRRLPRLPRRRRATAMSGAAS